MIKIPTIADKDPWLEPYRDKLELQQAYIHQFERRMLGTTPVEDFALGHLYFGLHATDNGWVLREWAPNADQVFLVNDATGWNDDPSYEFHRIDNDVWELTLPKESLTHEMLYKLHLHWNGGDGMRLPAYTTFTHQDPDTHEFTAVVWQPPRPYQWQHEKVANKVKTSPRAHLRSCPDVMKNLLVSAENLDIQRRTETVCFVDVSVHSLSSHRASSIALLKGRL